MTSWKTIEKWNHMGKWNKTSFVLLWGWLSLLLFSPYMIDNGSTGDLSGVVGKYDNRDVIEEMNFLAKFKSFLSLKLIISTKLNLISSVFCCYYHIWLRKSIYTLI